MKDFEFTESKGNEIFAYPKKDGVLIGIANDGNLHSVITLPILQKEKLINVLMQTEEPFSFPDYLKEMGFKERRIMGGVEFFLRNPPNADFEIEFTFNKERERCFDFIEKYIRVRNMFIPQSRTEADILFKLLNLNTKEK